MQKFFETPPRLSSVTILCSPVEAGSSRFACLRTPSVDESRQTFSGLLTQFPAGGSLLGMSLLRPIQHGQDFNTALKIHFSFHPLCLKAHEIQSLLGE